MLHTRYKTADNKSAIDVLNLNQQKSQNVKWFAKQLACYSGLYHKVVKHNQICILVFLSECLMLQAVAQISVATEILLFSVVREFFQGIWKTAHMQKGHPQNFINLISDESYRNRKKGNSPPSLYYCMKIYEHFGLWITAAILLCTAIFELLLEYIFIYYFPSVCISCVPAKCLPLYMQHRNIGEVTMNYVLERRFSKQLGLVFLIVLGFFCSVWLVGWLVFLIILFIKRNK